MPYGELMKKRLLDPLGLRSTTLPVASTNAKLNPRGEIPEALRHRAVQGYSNEGVPIGVPGDLQGYYHWLGTGQMYSSARDMAVFLMANLGELPDREALQEAMRRAQRGTFPTSRGVSQALAWEVHKGEETIVDKYGGMNNASAYIGLIPERRIGVVILGNRGSMAVTDMGRGIILARARPRRPHPDAAGLPGLGAGARPEGRAGQRNRAAAGGAGAARCDRRSVRRHRRPPCALPGRVQ